MPHKDPETKRAYDHQRYLEHAEERKQYQRRLRAEHLEEARERDRLRYHAGSHGKDAKREWARRNPEKNRASARRSWQKQRRSIRRETFARYSHGEPQCACCGERTEEFLSIDHVNGGGNQHRKSLGLYGAQFYLWLKKQGWPEGYRVLCHNCNQAIGYFGYCPHRQKEGD